MKEEYQKWDYITLTDFHAYSCGPVTSYLWLWFLAIVGIAVYGLDTFTAVNLLAFNHWSSSFEPYIPLNISKWIFAGCILFSWILLGYEWFVAVRVMRRGNVAESYLDPLAVSVQSMRVFGGGKGWRRFLVFAELTKSKKGADYVAFFVYFQLKGAIRVLLAEGPRQVVNGITLYSLLRADALGDGNDAGPSFNAFWTHIKQLYEETPEQAVVLATMLFTLIIWIFSALSLLVAIILWVGFLSHYIPSESRTLARYCRAKVDKRLARVVNDKTKQAIDREEYQRRKDAEKVGDAFAKPAGPVRQPTLPTLGDGKSPSVSTLEHSNSFSSTSSYPSKSGAFAQPTLPTISDDDGDGRQPTLPHLDDADAEDANGRRPTLPQLGEAVDPFYRGVPLRPNTGGSDFSQPGHRLAPGLARSTTSNSNYSMSSFGSNQPLLPNSADPGYAPSPIEDDSYNMPPLRQAANDSYFPPRGNLARTNTGMSNMTAASANTMPPPRMTALDRKPLPNRSMTSSSQRPQGPGGPPPQRFDAPYRGPPNGVRNFSSTFREPIVRTQSPLSYDTDGQSYEMQPPSLQQPSRSHTQTPPPRSQSSLSQPQSQPQSPSQAQTQPHPAPQMQPHRRQSPPQPTNTTTTPQPQDPSSLQVSTQTSAHSSANASISSLAPSHADETEPQPRLQHPRATPQQPRAFTPPAIATPSRALTVSSASTGPAARTATESFSPPPRSGTAPLPLRPGYPSPAGRPGGGNLPPTPYGGSTTSSGTLYAPPRWV